jgi:hypothetical protein
MTEKTRLSIVDLLNRVYVSDDYNSRIQEMIEFMKDCKQNGYTADDMAKEANKRIVTSKWSPSPQLFRKNKEKYEGMLWYINKDYTIALKTVFPVQIKEGVPTSTETREPVKFPGFAKTYFPPISTREEAQLIKDMRVGRFTDEQIHKALTELQEEIQKRKSLKVFA